MRCEPAGLPSWRTFVVALAACRVPTGQHRKAWDTGTSELRQGQGRALSQGSVWERLAPPGIFQLCGGSQEGGPPLAWALLRPGSRAWGPSLWSLQTYYWAPGCCFQSSVSKGELVPETRATGGRGEEGQFGPLGPALALLSRAQHSARTRGRQRRSSVTVQRWAGTRQDPVGC